MEDIQTANSLGRAAKGSSTKKVAMRLEGLWKTFPGANQPAVHDLTLEVYDGEVVTLLGPSGCGKTTTLRLVAGLETPDAGSIYLGDKPVVVTSENLFVRPHQRNVGMVFQSYAVWPHMSVAQNVAFPLKAHRYPAGEVKERVRQVLELVDMAGFEERPAPLLSGGQQQRVAIARALVLEPSLLLLDEPFSNLDAKLREQMRLEVKLLQKRLNMAVLLVTHDQIEALSLSDRIALMNFGVVQQQGSPQELYENPRNEFVRDFVGKTLLFRGKVHSSNPSGQVAVALEGAQEEVVFARGYDPEALSDGSAVFIAVRPEDVQLHSAGDDEISSGMLRGKIQTRLFLGDHIEYHVDVDGQGIILVGGDRRRPLEEESDVWLRIEPDGHSAWSTDLVAAKQDI